MQVRKRETLADQIALVSGARRGIGRAIALELAARGAAVIGTATTPAGASAIQGVLDEHGASGWGAVMQVNDAATVDAVIGETEKRFGAVSILVNSAAVTRDNLALRMKDEEWTDVINTNLSAVFRLSRAVMRQMIKARYGRIINISSVVGSSGNPGQANYAAAKAGLEGMSRSLARELGSRNITVNCVAPGLIDTDMTSALSEGQRDALLAQIPLGRLGRPEDVAAAVAFLASPEAGYVTGTTLHINGGMYMC